MFKKSFALLATTSVIALIQPAYAQNQTAKPNDIEEIVVTGTEIRGVAPAGAQTFGIDQAEIQATSTLSTDQLLATLPQLNSFGTLAHVNDGGTQLTVNRINLRNLPQGVGGGSPTLILLDGHRMVGAGARQDYPDPDVVPPALIERVDVLTDGGSAIYGSDAIGGVINFITKKNFDGVEGGVRQGFGDSYKSTDLNFTAGKSWTNGSAYIGYNFSRHDAILGRDRAYVKNINYTTGLPTSLNCSPANAVVGGATYAVTGGNALALGNANICDPSKLGSEIYPEEYRHSVMAGFRQDLNDNLEFDIKSYYSTRIDNSGGGPLTGTGTVSSTNPNYIPTSPGNTATQTVSFNFAPVGGIENVQTKLWSYGITPTLTWKFGSDWQAKALYNFGQSQTTANDPLVNTVALGTDITAGTINPYNIAASNSAALGQVLNQTNYAIGKDKMHNAKVVVDGPLFKLPGGQVKVAFGGEYTHEQFQGTLYTGTNEGALLSPLTKAARNVKAGFAELNIPIVGPQNNIPFIYSFNASAAERYDSYSDFGHNWAPSLGASLKPIDWINLRGRWNKSFQAPSLVQISQAGSPQAGIFPGFIVGFVPLLANPAVPFNGGPIVAVQGTVSPLQPQKSRAYDFGFDVSPPVVSGLNLHMTYWNIIYSGQISAPPLGSGPFYNVPGFANLFTMLPTIAQVQTTLANAGVPAAAIAQTIAGLNGQGNPYVVADVRARNLGISKTDGFDFAAEYQHRVSFGSIYASFSSSLTSTAIAAADGTNYTVNQAGLDGTRFNSATTLGAKIGDHYRAQITWDHIAGYRLSIPAQLNQTTVAGFNTFDLYGEYKVERSGLPPVTLSLGITNLFDTNPPKYNGVTAGSVGGGYTNGQTTGRVFQLGANVKF